MATVAEMIDRVVALIDVDEASSVTVYRDYAIVIIPWWYFTMKFGGSNGERDRDGWYRVAENDVTVMSKPCNDIKQDRTPVVIPAAEVTNDTV